MSPIFAQHLQISLENSQRLDKLAENLRDSNTFIGGCPMLREERKNPHPHENWCLNVALRFCGRPRIHERFRQNRVVDAILFMPDPVDLWGPLAGFLAQRDVLIEHFSDSVSTADYSSCQEKIAYAGYQYNRIPLKDRGEKRHPVAVILSHRRPDRLIREPGLFEATEYPGIWLRRPLELGAMFLIATTHLPD